MRPIRIASRPSRLALAQTYMIKEALQAEYPGLGVSVLTVTTRGDRDRSAFLYKSQSQGLFTSEVERTLLDGRADVAVHSLKDLPTAGAPELMVAAIPPRESPADALVTRLNVTSWQDLPTAASVGTSSLRRIAQLQHLRPDLHCGPLRGNVETRLAKVTAGDVDAAVMACAGLHRLGLSESISVILPLEDFLPAPAQGALAVQVRREDNEVRDLMARLDDPDTRLAAETERHVLHAMHGGCSIPLGVYARMQGDTLHIDAMISDVQGQNYIRRDRTSVPDQALDCAADLARELLDAGGREILHTIREQKSDSV